MNLRERVLALLPLFLTQRLAGVEALLGRAVTFVMDPALEGLALAKASSEEGSIHLCPSITLEVLSATAGLPPSTMGVIGEEIMHLVRRADRYPAIQPQQEARNGDYDLALSCLSGHFEEHGFFPFLESLGLDPRSAITPTIEVSANMLSMMLERIRRDGPTAKWRVRLSTLFVQASLMAPESAARTRLLELFDSPVLAQYAGLGRFLIDEIRAAEEGLPQVEERMRRCVQRLGLLPESAIVAAPPFPS